MTQFTLSHHGILILRTITTYLDAKRLSKKTCFLCEQLIQAKTPDFTRGRLYERVKMFYVQRKIGDFHKDFIFNSLKNYPTTAVTTKYLENHVADIRHKAFESTPGDISNRSDYSKQFIFEPDNQLQNEFFDNNRTLSMEG